MTLSKQIVLRERRRLLRAQYQKRILRPAIEEDRGFPWRVRNSHQLQNFAPWPIIDLVILFSRIRRRAMPPNNDIGVMDGLRAS